MKVFRPQKLNSNVAISIDQGQTPGSVQISDSHLSVEPEAVFENHAEPELPPSELTSNGDSDDAQEAPSSGELRYDESSELGQLLETSSDLTGRIAAFRGLATIWQRSLPQKLLLPVCQALELQKLNCLGFSLWSELRRFNRPAIIVVAHQQQLHRVIVVAINDDTATVLVGDNSLQVPLNELKNRWANNGVTFWQPSNVGGALLQAGAQGPHIPAARGLLNTALGKAKLPLLESINSWEFDSDMAKKVSILQSAYKITADGQIGNETYLLVNELSGTSDLPVLTQRVRRN